MSARASAFAVLGLEPGADAAAIEQAYKQLIKQHHPDREGGDSKRAAEINRAYRELRGGKATMDPLQFNEDLRDRNGRSWTLAAVTIGLAVLLLLFALGPSVPLPRALWPTKAQASSERDVRRKRPLRDPMEEQLHTKAIDSAVRAALQTFRTKDEFALANESRDCERRLRQNLGTEMLDRCAAFDDAVVGLEDRDPLRDAGPFAPLAVTGRQWSAASSLSEDDLAIDTRLDRIRLRVEMALAVQEPPPQANSN